MPAKQEHIKRHGSMDCALICKEQIAPFVLLITLFTPKKYENVITATLICHPALSCIGSPLALRHTALLFIVKTNQHGKRSATRKQKSSIRKNDHG